MDRDALTDQRKEGGEGLVEGHQHLIVAQTAVPRTQGARRRRSYFVDNDPSGTSASDMFGSAGDVFRGARRLGTYTSACTASSADAAQCQATLAWKGGASVQLAGEYRIQKVRNRIAISATPGGSRGGNAVIKLADDMGQVQSARLVILR